MCEVDGGTVALSSSKSIDCNIENDAGINSLNDIFMFIFYKVATLTVTMKM